jgi:uncharacterized protein (DUF2235 family)
MKNIVICCDGTGNEYGDRKSNVISICQCLDSAGGRQISYYHPGVGTMGDMRALSELGKAWTKFRGLAFGYGLSENIADAYRYLMQTFEPGDAVYIFGFSRGAYTARALCGMLQMVGLLCPGNEGLIPYAMRLFKRRDGFLVKLKASPKKFRIAAGFKKTFGRECKPHFLGVWDTVSSVGWILDPIGLKPGSLPYTYALEEVSILRHAVSLDERRAFFRSNLIDEKLKRNLKQVWFAGVHSDVGGGYPEAESGLSKITLKWMLREAVQAGLLLDATKVRQTVDRIDRAKAVANAPMHNSLTAAWWLGEFWPKLTKKKVSAPGVEPVKYRGWPRLNLFRRRFVPDGSWIHESVLKRNALLPSYEPANVPRNANIEPDQDSLPVAVLLSPGQRATFAVFAALKWNNTNLQVRSNEVYELSATGTWYDASISSGPAGYQSSKLLMRLFSVFRRRRKDPWFALIGATEQRKKNTFPIGKYLLWQVKDDGALQCYANDLHGFYFNNSGVVILTVVRKS